MSAGASIPAWMSNALSLPSGDHGTARIPSFQSTSNLSDSRILLTFAARVMIASPCSVTTTASDDEFILQTNTPDWDLGSQFPGLAGMYKIFSPNSRINVLCSLCSRVSLSLPMSHLFIKCAVKSTSQHSIPIRCSRAAFGVLASPATSATARSMIPLDLPKWWSLQNGLASGT